MTCFLNPRLIPGFAVPPLALAFGLAALARPAEASLLVPGANVTLQAVINTQYVCADNGGSSPLIANRTVAGSWETFTVVNAGNGNIALKATANGKYVDAANGGNSALIADSATLGSAETFTEVDQGGNNIGLRAAVNGHYVCADNTGSSPLIANRTSVGSFETFTVNAPVALRASRVYVGSLNGWGQLAANPNQWNYVRANADGLYVNFIQMLPTVGSPGTTSAQIEPLMTHQNAYFESDSRYTGLGGFPNGGQYTLATEAQEMDELLNAGFTITYTSLNYGVDTAKQSQCKTYRLPAGTTRPCLAQNGPWTFNGDVHNDPSSSDINNSDGVSTDGPLDLWASNSGGMQQGSVSDVKYAHSLNKLAMVMVSPGQLPASQWLATVQQCVRYQENQGAKPDIWADYAYDTYTPTLPETNVDGSPANTVTGAAFWLIHHLIDPVHWARLSLPAIPGLPTSGLHLCAMPTTLAASVREARANTGTLPRESTEASLRVPITRLANGRFSATQVIDLSLHNESTWMDLSPVLYADIDDPGHNWTVGFRLGGKDITRAVVQQGGFAFIQDERLWPSASKRLQLVLTCRNSSAGASPVTVRIGLLANPTRRDKLNETLTIHGSTMNMADGTVLVQMASADGARQKINRAAYDTRTTNHFYRHLAGIDGYARERAALRKLY